MRVLGLDVGEKRIGVARADSSTRIAVPVGFINVDGSEWQEIAKIARLNGTNFFVVGLPRSNEGNETAQSAYVRNFAKTLVEKIPEARIRFQDESLTSVVAEERLKARRKVYGKGEIDAEAAAIILQDFLEGFGREATKEPAEASFSDETAADPQQTQSPEKEEKVVKKKKKRGLVAFIIVIVALVVAGAATGGVLWYKQQRDEERARYYAELEAQQNAESVFQFTIRPGETIYEIKRALIEVGYSETEVDEAFNADYDFAFLQGRPEGATLEGYLLGETYEFYKTDGVKEILTKYLAGMEQVIVENNLEERYVARGLSLHEGVILASIVQSEAGRLTSEMPTVAQVFLSRLEYGIMLGSDVTVSYALDTLGIDRDSIDGNYEALKIDSCYNTRTHAGLPCGPISNPGVSALLAVAEPSDTAYLYFLTGDDGLMYYSYTESEHIQNIYSHCQDLCNTSL